MKLKFLGIFIGLILLVFILYFSDAKEVFKIILSANLNFIFLAAFFFLISIFLKSLRWQFFLKSIGIKVPYSQAFYSFNSAMIISNLVPFKALEVLRGYFLKLKYKISFSKTVPLVLTERALDVFVYILFSLITIQTMSNFIPFHFTTLAFFGMLIFFLVSISVLLVLNNKKLMLKFFNFFVRFPIIKKFKKDLERIVMNFSIGFNKLKNSKFFIQIISLTFLIWVVEGMIFIFSAKAVGIDLPISLFALPLISILLGTLTFIPGGTGSTEAVLILLISFLGFPLPQATSATLIYRGFVHLLENSIGVVVISQVYGFNIIEKIKRLK
ncbi:MAG: lysylphosphatidylglycerol synthase transmembrane domain-containing protein [Candidatus Aenigmatarchaeota archaeon]